MGETDEYRGRDRELTDPTALTTDQLRRELSSLSDQLSERIEGVIASFSVRLDAIDKATSLFDANLNRIPTAVDRAVGQLKELHDQRIDFIEQQLALRDADLSRLYDEKIESVYRSINDQVGLRNEKFAGVEKQFAERDTRVEQTAKDTKVAVDAALQAAEKAVGKQNESFALSIAKSETATTKQIDQQSTTLQTVATAIDSKIIDIKDRVGRIENQAIGWAQAENKQTVVHTSSMSSTGNLIGWIVAAVALATFFLTHLSTSAK